MNKSSLKLKTIDLGSLFCKQQSTKSNLHNLFNVFVLRLFSFFLRVIFMILQTSTQSNAIIKWKYFASSKAKLRQYWIFKNNFVQKIWVEKVLVQQTIDKEFCILKPCKLCTAKNIPKFRVKRTSTLLEYYEYIKYSVTYISWNLQTYTLSDFSKNNFFENTVEFCTWLFCCIFWKIKHEFNGNLIVFHITSFSTCNSFSGLFTHTLGI